MTAKNFFKVLLPFLLILFLIVGVVVNKRYELIEMDQYTAQLTFAASKPDAIAIRVIPNPENYNPSLWYKKQGFQGSFKELTIDGYSAIRSGRNTYVNVGNVDDQGTPDPSDDKISTYIYKLSYSQDVEPATREIYKRIINNWRFNISLDHDGQCNISNITCRQNKDCPDGYICGSGDYQENKCIFSSPKDCGVDADCSTRGIFCNSEKAKVVRDVKRLEDMATINSVLKRYKKQHGALPTLKAGTYLQRRSLSVWPSWDRTLASELGTSLPMDPINALGACEAGEEIDCLTNPGQYNFDLQTCWDDEKKWFADSDCSLPITMPNNSLAYYYKVGPNGLNYSLSFGSESDYLDSAAGSFQSGVVYNQVTNNKEPIIQCGSLIEYPGEEFEGYVNASDPEGSGLKNWNIDTTYTSWPGWSAAPTLEDIGVDGQRKIHASETGEKGSYGVKISVSDAAGVTANKECIISISEGDPIVSPISDKVIDPIGVDNLDFEIRAGEPSGQYPLDFIFSGNPAPVPYSLESNQHDAVVNFTVDDGAWLDSNNLTDDHDIQVVAQDTNGDISSSKEFHLEVVNRRPVIDTSSVNECPNQIRRGGSYPQEAYDPHDHAGCDIEATDPDGHTISSYSLSGAPAGVSIDNNGHISGTPTDLGNYTMEITVADEYGAESYSESYTLSVNTYCGDGSVQNNTENRGGPNGNGNEDCEGNHGVAGNPANSSQDKQYECTTPPVKCPRPGEGSCQYGDWTSCTAAGGWCGDGVIQDGGVHSSVCNKDYGEICDDGIHQNCKNCNWATLSEGSQTVTLDKYLSGGNSTSFNLSPCVSGSQADLEVDVDFDHIDKVVPSGWSGTDGLGIIFLTDESGSMGMGTSKMDDAKTAVKNAIDRLNNDIIVPAEVGLIGFSENNDEYGPIDLNNSNVSNLKSEVDTYSAGGGTYMSSALTAAKNMLDGQDYPQAKVVLMSDGQPNGDPKPQANDIKNVSEYKLYTVAFGSGADTGLMETMASDPSSNYFYTGSNIGDFYDDIVDHIINNTNATVEIQALWTGGGHDEVTVNAHTANNINLNLGCDPWNSRTVDLQPSFNGSGEVYFGSVDLDLYKTNPGASENSLPVPTSSESPSSCLSCSYFDCGSSYNNFCCGTTGDCGGCGGGTTCVNGFCE